MKKFLILIIGILTITNCVIARDYTKIQHKELNHARKYGTTQIRTQYFNNNLKRIDFTTKDPHILRLGEYDVIDSKTYSEKLNTDEEEYKKIEKTLKTVNIKNYNSQATGDDYYRIYRITERIIRANRLDYQIWRVGITREPDTLNAYSVNGNYINLYTSIIDSCSDNDDALAMTIGHEIAHILLGHQRRRVKTIEKLNRLYRRAKTGNSYAIMSYNILKRKLLIDTKNMEYAADVEGAKLAAKAGYDMNKAVDILLLFESIDSGNDYHSDHPTPKKRIENFNQNIKMLPQAEWREWGKYNIYNTSVLDVKASSDRKSIIISGSEKQGTSNEYYNIDSVEDINLRYAYASYLNGDYEKSLKYYEKYFSTNKTNAIAYLYASYAAIEAYNRSTEIKYKTLSETYIKMAKNLNPKNTYIREQEKQLKQ